MSEELLGTGELVRLAVRRDRWLLPVLALAPGLMAAFSAAATLDLYPDQASRIEAAQTVNATAALVALYGRIYDPTSLGALSLFKLTALGAAILSVAMVALVVRHTRAEEETGRLELLGAGALGRSAPLAAALIVSTAASVALGVVTTVGLGLVGLSWTGATAFGFAWATTAAVFGAVGAVAAQLTTAARAATGLGLIVVAIAYVLRAVGDLSEQGPGWVSWLSPIGWNQQVRAFAGEQWGVLLLPVLAFVLLVPLAVLLRRRRDLGAGVVADRPGPGQGRLRSVLGLGWRLQQPQLLAWTAAVALFGAVLGSIAHNVSGLLQSAAVSQLIETLGGTQGLTDAFLAAEMGLISVIIAAYGITAADRLRHEETADRAEPVLTTAITRVRWAAGYWVTALVGVTWLMLVAGAAVGLGHGLAIDDLGQVPRLTAAALGQVPALWVLVGIVVAVWGFLPRATAGVWGLYVAFIVVGEFGSLWKLPQALIDVSPFTHSPVLPSPDPQLAGIGWLLVAAVVLLAAGSQAFRNRDLAP